MKTVTIQELANSSGAAFGTSGVRGLVAQMTPDVCAAYTLAFLQALGDAPVKRIAVGIDLRPSSPSIAQACILALELAGIEAEYCGVLPTPALAFHAMQEGIPAIMVTGSHIPFDRNGIKFYLPGGEISKADEAAITGATVQLPDALVLRDLPSLTHAAEQRYIERHLQFFPDAMLAGLRIGFYQHSSTARDLLTTLLERLGAEVVPLGRTDKFVPIDTEAVSAEDAARAKAWVKEYQLDALLSTDGDADRPLISDERGVWFRGDVVGLLCAKFLEAEALATPVSCTTAIEKSGWFEHIARTRIGSPYVIEGMEALLAAGKSPVVGFEANGGFLLGSDVAHAGKSLQALPTRDAVLPMLALMALAREKGVPLSALASELPARFTASDRIQNIAKAQSAKLLRDLEVEPEPLTRIYGAVSEMNLTDGLRLTFENGEIIHLRPSGNAPELRCYAEADNAKRAEQLVDEVLRLVSSTV